MLKLYCDVSASKPSVIPDPYIQYAKPIINVVEADPTSIEDRVSFFTRVGNSVYYTGGPSNVAGIRLQNGEEHKLNCFANSTTWLKNTTKGGTTDILTPFTVEAKFKSGNNQKKISFFKTLTPGSNGPHVRDFYYENGYIYLQSTRSQAWNPTLIYRTPVALADANLNLTEEIAIVFNPLYGVCAYLNGVKLPAFQVYADGGGRHGAFGDLIEGSQFIISGTQDAARPGIITNYRLTIGIDRFNNVASYTPVIGPYPTI